MMKLFAALGFVATAGVLSICPLCDAAKGAVSNARNGFHSPSLAYEAVATTVAHVPAVNIVTLKVTGMTCGGCVLGVRKVLTRLPGVTTSDVSYEGQRAMVSYDPARVTVAQIVAAIGTLGYTATVVAS